MNPSHAPHLFQVTVALAEGLEFRAKTLRIMLYIFGVSLGRQHLLINLTIKKKKTNELALKDNTKVFHLPKRKCVPVESGH